MGNPSESAVAARLFVDSSAWLAFVSARDSRHGDADRLVRAALRHKHRLFTSNLVLAEVQRLLLFRAGPRPAAAALAQISASPSVELLFPDLPIHRDAQAWLAKFADQVISYTDASSFALMKAHRCEAALTFDRDFALAGFPLWQG
jgi:predicted nucleic acid-binding protein